VLCLYFIERVLLFLLLNDNGRCSILPLPRPFPIFSSSGKGAGSEGILYREDHFSFFVLAKFNFFAIIEKNGANLTKVDKVATVYTRPKPKSRS